MSVNSVQLIGKLGADPELSYTGSGDAVCKFRVATNEKWTAKDGTKQERTTWHRVEIWKKQAELCNQYLKKGSDVYVDGKISVSEWEDKHAQKREDRYITAKYVKFLGGGKSAESKTKVDGADFSVDDIPF